MSETGNPSDPAQPPGPMNPGRSTAGRRRSSGPLPSTSRPWRRWIRQPKFLRTVATIDRLASAVQRGCGDEHRMLERRLDMARGLLAARARCARAGRAAKIVDELSPRGWGTVTGGLSTVRAGVAARRDGRWPTTSSACPFQLHRTDPADARRGTPALERDNAAWPGAVSLATVMESLREHAYLAGRLDEALTAQVDVVARTDPERADYLRADLLHAIRRRRQEILTQLAVTTQGYASLRIVEESNEGMVRAPRPRRRSRPRPCARR